MSALDIDRGTDVADALPPLDTVAGLLLDVVVLVIAAVVSVCGWAGWVSASTGGGGSGGMVSAFFVEAGLCLVWR